MEYFVENFSSYKLHMIKTDKFKTVNVKVIFSSYVKKEEITKKNFLADMLTFSSKKYPNRKELSIALQDLYAMNVFSNCYRIGKLYNMDINASFLNEKYTEKGMFEESIKLISELIFDPNVSNNKFDNDSFNIITQMTKNQIDSIKENTRKLSLIKMLENMGKNEIYSYHGYGYLDDLFQINTENLYNYYLDIMKNNKIDIYVLGDIDINNTKKVISKYFEFNTVKIKRNQFSIEHSKYRKNIKKVIEEEKISQSKLSIGCKIEHLSEYESNYVLPIFSMILGGGTDSKMFREIREKNSLCYYISASANKLDNIMFITSGISSNNFEKVIKLVKKNFKDMIKGDFDEKDINNAKIQYITMLDELQENAFQIISTYYSIDTFNYDSIDVRKEKISEVTYEDIKDIGSKIHIDTIYLLKGDE